MNLGCIVDGEYPDLAAQWFPDDTIAPTLEPVLRLLFADWGVQLLAEARFTNAWLDANKDLPSGHIAAGDGQRAVHAALGKVRYPWRGVLAGSYTHLTVPTSGLGEVPGVAASLTKKK